MEPVKAFALLWKGLVAFLLLLTRPSWIEKGIENGTGVPGALTWKSNRDCLFNRTLALYVVEYAAAVYIENSAKLLTWSCSRCQGLTRNFNIVELVIDEPHRLQAYVGIAEDLKSVVVAFRGTQENSYQNWAEDLYFKQLDLNYPGIEDALVHKGFYQAYHNTTLRDLVIKAIMRILKHRKDLSVIVTGHSMGGALATFCALDLTVNYAVDDLKVITFGQPRIGNAIFAAAYGVLVPDTVRMTHAHDIVPHLPPYYALMAERTYHHFATEVWIYKIQFGRLLWEFERVCDSSGEDPTCSRSMTGNSISDHLSYFGVSLNTIDD
ncbi:unnamed protein product [Calypogeia fissa]